MPTFLLEGCFSLSVSTTILLRNFNLSNENLPRCVTYRQLISQRVDFPNCTSGLKTTLSENEFLELNTFYFGIKKNVILWSNHSLKD